MSDTLLRADIQLIQRILPHRYPFLLVDRVEEIDGTQSALGIKNVTMNEPHFQGHFPGTPIMPGVTIIEAMAQTAAVMVGTALDLADTDRPEHVYFNSLLPQISGDRTETHYPSVLGSYLGKQRAIIRDGWKLILYPPVKAVRLYHVAADPTEAQDLAPDSRHEGRKRALFAELLKLQAELGDFVDLPAIYPELL